jgi:ParB-like chromosome segregation protein Spo0J
MRSRPPSARAEREARRIARAQKLADGPSAATLALQKAQRWQAQIEGRGLRRADIARAEGITRARVTQVMRLLDLPADLQGDLTTNKSYTRSWSVRYALEMAAG